MVERVSKPRASRAHGTLLLRIADTSVKQVTRLFCLLWTTDKKCYLLPSVSEHTARYEGREDVCVCLREAAKGSI